MTSPEVEVVVVAAVAANGVIGTENSLPWHIPSDLRRFRELTLGHPVIMGRRTFESLRRPLPDRTNIVLSRDPSFVAEGGLVRGDFDSALRTAAAAQQGDVFVIGGADVYRQALDVADRIELTVVDGAFAGDRYFPPLDTHRWTCVRSHVQPRGHDDELSVEFRTYVGESGKPSRAGFVAPTCRETPS